MKTKLFVVIIVVCSFLLPESASSQDWYAPPPPPPEPLDTPIDGGLSLLVAAGVGYGIKKVRDSRKKG